MFAVLLALGVSVAIALCAASLATMFYLGLPADVLIIETAAGTDSATLIAIPLFIFAGQLMLHGGISARLIAFASALVGHVRGGLGQVNVLSCLLFGGVSDSAIADVSAIGGAMIPQMVERGYDRDYAVNVTISAALVALLVPPSHNLILYSAVGRRRHLDRRSVRGGHRSCVAVDAERDGHRLPDRAQARLRDRRIPGRARGRRRVSSLRCRDFCSCS